MLLKWRYKVVDLFRGKYEIVDTSVVSKKMSDWLHQYMELVVPDKKVVFALA